VANVAKVAERNPSGGSEPHTRRLVLIGFGAILAGFNLRLAIASVPPLLTDLQHQPGISSTGAAILTALPFCCFGVVALAAPRLLRLLGAETALMLVLATTGTGTLLRAAGSTAALLAGTAVAAGAIAIGNVILPVLIKTRFPARTGLLIGLYTAALSLGAALAGAVTVPLARWLGWQWALAAWAIPALIPLAPLILGARPRNHRPGREIGSGIGSLLGDRLAWQVTLFFGLQAAIVFSGLSWLPSVLRADGYSASTAGLLLALYALGGVPASMTVPVLATKAGNQRLLTTGCAAIEAAALGLLVAIPAAAPAWIALFALGQGASFSLAVTLIGLRSPDARRSADLSGMTQAIGYATAAAGPLAVGLLHGAAGSWTVPLLFLILLCLPMAAVGAGAGRAQLVGGGSLSGLATDGGPRWLADDELRAHGLRHVLGLLVTVARDDLRVGKHGLERVQARFQARQAERDRRREMACGGVGLVGHDGDRSLSAVHARGLVRGVLHAPVEEEGRADELELGGM
jgi:CP family cyanate transporter-like MFS transporter